MPKKTTITESTMTAETPTAFEQETADNSTAIKLIQKDLSYISTDVSEIKKSVTDLTATISEKFVGQKQHLELEGRVSKIESVYDWAVRIVLGSIIAALLALVLRGGVL